MESRTRLPPEEMKTARARARAVGLARGRCVAPLPKSAAFVPRNHGWQERGGEIDPGQSDEAIDDARHRVGRPELSRPARQSALIGTHSASCDVNTSHDVA